MSLYQSIKQRKSVFYRFSPHYLLSNEDASAVYHTVIQQSRHLRTLQKCEKYSPMVCVCYISLVFSNACVVSYHSVIHGLGFFIC